MGCAAERGRDVVACERGLVGAEAGRRGLTRLLVLHTLPTAHPRAESAPPVDAFASEDLEAACARATAMLP